MHIAILGASRFGVATAHQLVNDGHEVVLIDIDRERLDALADGLDCAMICGDGTLPSTLRDAYGDGSDALVTLTNEDDVNILSAVVGRSIGFDRVVPQIVRAELLSVVEELDLDDVITPHESLARSIASGLTEHSDVETDLLLHRELRVVSQTVPAALDGKTMSSLEIGEGVRPVALCTEDGEVFASDECELSKGDRLLFVAKAEETKGLTQYFQEKDTS